MKIGAKIGISHTKDINNAQIAPPIGRLVSSADSYAMYGLRKLNENYTDNTQCIRVRRDGDSAGESDIGFDAQGNLDVKALETFCSGVNCFVKTWYDQSGTNKDLTQTGTGKQPEIVSSGVVHTANDKPTMKFDGGNDLVKRSIGTDDSSPHSIFFVYRLDGTVAANDGLLSFHETADTAMIKTNSSKVIEVNFGNAVTVSNANTSNTLFQLSMITNGSDSTLALNGRNSSTVNLGSNDIELIVLGREEGETDSNNTRMSCSELIIFSRAVTAEEFQEIHNSVNVYYNLG
jgi:hypothetical protein